METSVEELTRAVLTIMASDDNSDLEDEPQAKKAQITSIPRKRWDSDYLRSLAIKEGSFTAEYRMDPVAFMKLHSLLESTLQVDTTKAIWRPKE